MAQRKPEDKTKLEHVLKLVDELSPEDRQELYRKLDLKTWAERWHTLCTKVDKQNSDLPRLSEEEILAEMNAIRREVQAKRAQSSN